MPFPNGQKGRCARRKLPWILEPLFQGDLHPDFISQFPFFEMPAVCQPVTSLRCLPSANLSEGWTHTLHTLTPSPAHFFPGAQWLFVNRLNVQVQLSLPFISEPEHRNRHGLNCVLPKIQTLKPPPPGCQNVTVFGHGALKRPLRVDLNPVWTVSLYGEEIRTRTHTEGWHEEKAATCKPQREASQGTKPTDLWTLDFQPIVPGENKFLWPKPLNLWSFVMVALAE